MRTTELLGLEEKIQNVLEVFNEWMPERELARRAHKPATPIVGDPVPALGLQWARGHLEPQVPRLGGLLLGGSLKKFAGRCRG
jgi:hypothetical protein